METTELETEVVEAEESIAEVEVTEVVTKTPERKTIADIERVIALGKPRRVIEKFIELYRAGLGEDEFDESLAIEAELDSKEFKVKRNKVLDVATVTTRTGKVFDADNRSITLMGETIQAVKEAVELGVISDPDTDFPIQWVLHGEKPGNGTPILFNELREAFVLANQHRATKWVK